MSKFLHNHPDVLNVILAHLGAIAITLSDVETALKFISLITAIGYTLWKWRVEWVKNKNK